MDELYNELVKEIAKILLVTAYTSNAFTQNTRAYNNHRWFALRQIG
jgi:hypothetical protein